MPHPDWRGPVAWLRAQLAPLTAAQLELAAQRGVQVHRTTPGLVAAAVLRDALGPIIGVPSRPPSPDQLEYLNDLTAWSKRADPPPSTHAVASALLSLRVARRALEYLQQLRLATGDVVMEWRRSDLRPDQELDPQRLRLVASIANDGTVYFQGGAGRRAAIHRLDLIYRADDQSADAERARGIAANEARRHGEATRSTDALNVVKVSRLDRWRVAERPIHQRDVDELRGVIETADTEQPIQMYLQDHPLLLASVLSGGHGRWVCPQTRLGSRYVADFFAADADSIGIRWTLIELESPRVRALSAKGEWLEEARHAQHQIKSWRHYIGENLDAVRKDPQDEGLGLVDIDAGVPGLILISRRSIVAADPAWVRRTLLLDSGISMHTYDWLLDRLESKSRGRPSPFG